MIEVPHSRRVRVRRLLDIMVRPTSTELPHRILAQSNKVAVAQSDVDLLLGALSFALVGEPEDFDACIAGRMPGRLIAAGGAPMPRAVGIARRLFRPGCVLLRHVPGVLEAHPTAADGQVRWDEHHLTLLDGRGRLLGIVEALVDTLDVEPPSNGEPKALSYEEAIEWDLLLQLRPEITGGSEGG